LLHESGKVIAADVQEGMLDIVARKIKGTESEQLVELHKCQINSIGLIEKADFILAFWMVHEVSDHDRLFEELKAILKPDGRICIVEPKIHVTGAAFEEMTARVKKEGFEIVDRPKVFFSRALLLEHKK
jgi:ubiquinone/menaquinone biosynthesis C-methylase UbiE